jgi:hypothetical protein
MSLVEQFSESVRTVNEFCKRNGVCRTRLYALWAEGKGPRYFRNGTRRLITPEAEVDWRRAMENDTSASAR